jgi:hypothetical protein
VPQVKEDLMRFPGVIRARFAFSALGVLVSVFSVPDGATAQVAQPIAAQAQQKVWVPGEVNSGSARIYVRVFKTGMGHEHAVVGLVKEGVIHLGATRNAGRVVADLTSFSADPDYARKVLRLPGETDPDTQKKVTANMLGADVLDVLKFSTATGTIDSARLLQQPSTNGLPQYLLEGELTLHGVTKKMSVVVEAVEQNGWVRLRGHVSLRQSDFGMAPYTAMLGAIGVADQLELYGAADIVKENNIPPPVAPAGPVRQ